ncbi:Carcinine transporter [Nymphon striatum]|nr:Carcinine transporter [Nymphon striatum]
MDIDDILPIIGAFGRFQKSQFALLCIPAGLMAAIIAFHSTFISGTPTHWCNMPDLQLSNLTTGQIKQLSIPRSKTDANLYDSCLMYDVDLVGYVNNYRGSWPPEPLSTWKTKKCPNGWEYDRSVYEENLVIKEHFETLKSDSNFILHLHLHLSERLKVEEICESED